MPPCAILFSDPFNSTSRHLHRLLAQLAEASTAASCLSPLVTFAGYNAIAIYVVGSGAVSEGDRGAVRVFLHHSEELGLSIEL